METTPVVKNNARWLRKMRRIPSSVRIEASRAAETNARVMKAAAEREVRVRTGELRVTITAYPVRSLGGAVWRTAVGDRKGSGFYARFLEFGTRHSKADPFFFPVYRSLRPRFRARMGRALKKGHSKVT